MLLNIDILKTIQSFFAIEQNLKQFLESFAYELLKNYRKYPTWFVDVIYNYNGLKNEELHYFLVCKYPPYFEYFNRIYETNHEKSITYDEVMFDAFHEKEPFKIFYEWHTDELSQNYVQAVWTLPFVGLYANEINAMRSNKHYAHLVLQENLYYRFFCKMHKETKQENLANIYEICSGHFATTIGERVFADEYVVSIIARFL
jgi:hypothetical protein